MVTIIKKLTGGAYPFYEYACLSTDTKPVSLVPENSICHEIDTGKHFYFGNGEWKELPPQGGFGGGSGGEGLPADFPAEGIANANKFLGFDASGDYAALDAPSGGGAGKFVVTLTEESDTWTADKTVAEVVAAKTAGKEVVAAIGFGEDEDMAEIPLNVISGDGVVFSGTVYWAKDIIASAAGFDDHGTDMWVVNKNEVISVPSYSSSNNGQVLGVDDGDLAWVDPSGGSAEKFVVTLTQDELTEEWTAADGVTIAQIYAAHQAGKECVVQLTYECDGVDFPVEAPLTVAIITGEGGETTYSCVFSIPFVLDASTIAMLNVVGIGGDKDGWDVEIAEAGAYVPGYDSDNNGKVLGVSSGSLAWVDNYAPLIVTLTADQNTGNFVGDRTNKEVYDAFAAGQAVVLSASVGSSELKLAVQYATFDGTDYEFAFIDSTSVKNTVSGDAKDYVTASFT